MATTAIVPIHTGKGRGVAKALKDVTDYMADPSKTNFGEFVSSYMCTPETADAEFCLAKDEYHFRTGRSQGVKDVIAYHARQSFLPGEISPEEANRIGYELAMRFTKGKYSYIVTTHVNTNCVHNHIVWNSTRLDCRKKFRNFLGSAFALRRCSDILCAENGLSVIEKPKPSRGSNYADYVYGTDKPQAFKDQIRQAIDDALAKVPATFEDFIALIKAAGIKAERRGKNMRLMMPGQKQFTRLDRLRGNYTEEAIRERIAAHRTASAPAGKARTSIFIADDNKPSLLIDIQAKIQQGKGAGYAHWAAVQNLKQMAKTLIYLQERSLDNYDVLKEKTAAATARFNELSDRMKVLNEKLNANAALQKNIVTYSKTRATYVEYRKAGYSKAFKATHEADIILHQAAKKAFDELGIKKIPTIASLRAEYAPTLEEKKQIYQQFKQAREEMKELLVAKANVDKLLGKKPERDEIEAEVRRSM